MGLAEHLCAATALAYLARCAKFAGHAERIPIVERDDAQPSVSIIVPARNEQASIERCVRSLLAQTHHDFEVVVVDDCSTDATPAILARLSLEFPQLRVVRGDPLPKGWIGKPWALFQGTRLARGEWLLFTDADTYHHPHALTSTMALAWERGADAFSLGTYLELETFWERAVLPSIVHVIIFACGTYEELSDPARPDRALANGQFILVSRKVYEALGGHARLRGQIAEDLEFARLLKRDGRFRIAIANGEDLVAVRMYSSLGEIWSGFTKNVILGANGHVPTVLAGATFLAAISFVPPLLAVRALLRGRMRDCIEALLTSAASIAGMAAVLRTTRLPARLALYQPIGMAAFSLIAFNALLRVSTGRGVSWRGRSYPGRATPVHGGTPHAS